MPRSDNDWVLAALVGGASASGQGPKLTLFLGGFAVSGILVSEEVYFRRIGLDESPAKAIASREDKGQERAGLDAELGRDDLSPEERSAIVARLDDLEPQYVVMADITIFGAGAMPLTSAAWRGRLSQVTSWVLGSFESVESQ